MIKTNISYDTLTLEFHGEFGNNTSKIELLEIENILNNKTIRDVVINLDYITRFDISFLFFLVHILNERKVSIKFIANNTKSQNIITILEDIKNTQKQLELNRKKISFFDVIKSMYKRFDKAVDTILDFLNFIGILLFSLLKALIHFKTIRHNAISYHIYSGVISAMPIIFIVSFIVGGVIAYQGAATLEKMGFIQLAVSMTAKLTLREIGPFVVALIVAGRSASSYTAQIGVMKITEELNAMKTMNFNVMNFIIIPRFIALIISFPLMVFLSDLVSIFGSMVFLRFGFDVSFYDYISQLREIVGVNSFYTGIIKAPFYAAVIVIIGCFIGFRVEDNTQSVGEKTTASVVYALFGVILVNALFSLIFTELRF